MDHLVDNYRVSVRRAWYVIPFRRSSCYYQPVGHDDTALRRRIREIVETQVRYGIW